jgi:transposase
VHERYIKLSMQGDQLHFRRTKGPRRDSNSRPLPSESSALSHGARSRRSREVPYSRRAHLVQGKSIRAIARELRVSRKVVRKVLRTGQTEFRYEREVQPRPKLGRWREGLEGLLAANAGKPVRERLTLIGLLEELRGLGYEGGYDAVRRYARAWEKARGAAAAAAFVPLSFAPGEAYQFDWSHEIVAIAGVTTTVKVVQVRLCHSRMPHVRAYPRESQEMVFEAHDRAFAFFRGACARGIYDNMKTAVEAVLVGKD